MQKLTSRLHRGSQSSGGARESKEDAAQRETETRRLFEWEADKQSLDYAQILVEPSKKPVGHSSKVLRVSDFELLKTLGTGTFARVWLVKLTAAQGQDSNTVFALKKLRKADGMQPAHPIRTTLTRHSDTTQTSRARSK